MDINLPKSKIADHIKGILEAFLKCERYHDKFRVIAKEFNFDFNLPIDDLIPFLFTIKKGEIVFITTSLYDMFFEFQLFTNLQDKEPYASLLKKDPSAISNIVEIAKKVYNNEDIEIDKIKDLFN